MVDEKADRHGTPAVPIAGGVLLSS